MKKETIEEVAKRIYPINIVSDGYDTNMLCRTGFYIGYELAKERSYSEDEVYELMDKREVFWVRYKNTYAQNYISLREWFEQFKKK